MDIIFSQHAEEKFELLEKRGFPIPREKVLECIENPDRIEAGYKGRQVAQMVFDVTHVVRVVYVEEKGTRRIITFYPGRRDRYEDEL